MDDSKTMSTDAVPKEYVTRVNQAYRAYLTTTYNIDYYHEKCVRLANQTKHLDFLIALGAAASGGSGLGILAATEFAWACGVLTTISTAGAIAKGNYDWSGCLRKCFEIIEFIPDQSSVPTPG